MQWYNTRRMTRHPRQRPISDSVPVRHNPSDVYTVFIRYTWTSTGVAGPRVVKMLNFYQHPAEDCRYAQYLLMYYCVAGAVRSGTRSTVNTHMYLPTIA